MTDRPGTTDVRQAGWLPDQDGLEAWLAGHRDRVESQSEDVALHPVILEFQLLIGTDPVVRMYVERMIEQVPHTRNYQKRHLTGTGQLLRLINAVLRLAPEFGDQSVTLPFCAILDWTMGTRAGFAAYRDPRVNAVLRKILTASCAFLNSPDSRYVRNDSPTGWRARPLRRSASTSSSTTRMGSTGASARGRSNHRPPSRPALDTGRCRPAHRAEYAE